MLLAVAVLWETTMNDRRVWWALGLFAAGCTAITDAGSYQFASGSGSFTSGGLGGSAGSNASGGAGASASGGAGAGGGAGASSGAGANRAAASGGDEACNNSDDDLDTRVDEGLTRACGSSVNPLCIGTQTCLAGVWGSTCMGMQPTTEVCDANEIDEDCDGSGNEDCMCTDGKTKQCATSADELCQGSQTCSGGMWGGCVLTTQPGTEVCDKKLRDEDCDGEVNEGCQCVTDESRNCGTNTDVGACEFGVEYCANGKWSGACMGAKAPQSEQCNEADDDCDNRIDEGVKNACGHCGQCCGDGVITPELGEQCDPGNSGNGQGCSGCRIDDYYASCAPIGETNAGTCFSFGLPNGEVAPSLLLPHCTVDTTCPLIAGAPWRPICDSGWCFLACDSDASCPVDYTCYISTCWTL